MKLSNKVMSVLAAGVLLAMTAYAQSGTGVLSGKVIGRDGMPLAGAQLWIDRMNSLNQIQKVVAQRFDAKTGKNGSYTVNGLPPGGYVVSVLENGKPIMVFGDKVGDVVTVNNGREVFTNFDLTKAPPPVAAPAAAVAPALPAAADLAKEREEMTKVQANKKSRDAAFAAGQAAYKAKDFETAAKEFQVVVNVDPKQDVAWANLGNTFKELKKYDEASAAYGKAIELKPKEAAYVNNLGLVLGGAGKMPEAQKQFESAAMLDPAKGGEYLFNAGAMYYNAGDYTKAAEAFKRTLEVDPNNKGALLQLSISYFGSTETMPLAEPLLLKFLTLNPSAADDKMAREFLAALNVTSPTEFKSDKQLAEEKKAADAKARGGTKAPAPAAGKKP